MAQNLKKNYIYNLIYQVFSLITPFVVTPYISRILGADSIGVYSYTSSIMTYFTLFAALGTATYGEREIAQHRDDKYKASALFWGIELVSVISTLISLACWMILLIVNENYFWYFLALTPQILAVLFDISWFFRAYEQIKKIVVRNVICKVLGIVCLFIFVRDKDDLIYYFIINSLSVLIANLSIWLYLPKVLQKVDKKDIELKRHFKETLVYFVPTIATSVYTVLDKTLIGVITQDEFQNGYYEQASTVINLVKTATFTSVNTVMAARISYLFAQEKYDEIKARIARSMDFIMLISIGACVGLIVVADNFVPVYFGDGYDDVILLLQLMSPLVVIIGISNCLGGQYYNPAGLRSLSAKFIILGACVNLVLNLCFIPFMGAVGAVIASLIAETLISVCYFVKCNKFYTVKKLFKCTYKRLIAAAVMACVVLLIGKFLTLQQIYVLIIQILVGVITYFAVLLLLRDNLLIYLIKFAISKLPKKKKLEVIENSENIPKDNEINNEDK